MASDIPPLSDTTDPQTGSIDLLVRGDAEIIQNTHKSKRHTAHVRKMRLILPIAALAVVAILFAWTGQDKPVAPIPREQISPQTISQNELVNPKFQSEDAHSQPYTITADKATQNSEDMNKVFLQKPVADMTLKSGGWVSLKANDGVYLQGERHLDLDGQVEIHHDSGYELHTERMNIDVEKQIITSDLPVTGHGPSADITATGLSADQKENTVIFKGPAKLILRKAPSPTPTLSTEKDE
jgi:lipopolysaccharide export system protein LptC